ncbi:hypothetical protein GCM10009825_09270 [Arthrobacter humicola]|uniref:Uncharacterized protein n=1 Tax=Arthrobacter humicola TaxID=409291 RepID=A0ABN2YLC7_9MICC
MGSDGAGGDTEVDACSQGMRRHPPDVMVLGYVTWWNLDWRSNVWRDLGPLGGRETEFTAASQECAIRHGTTLLGGRKARGGHARLPLP